MFHKAPDPSKLHVFSCLCFLGCVPILPKNPILNLISPSVFPCCSLTHSAFLCFDLILNKIFMLCHVKFMENVFPFASPLIFTTPVVDTDSTLLASSFTSGDYPTPSTSSPSSHPYRCPHPNCRDHPHHSTSPPADLHLTNSYHRPPSSCLHQHHYTSPPTELPLPYLYRRAHPNYSLHHITSPVLPSTYTLDIANTIPVVVSFYWHVGSDTLPNLTLSPS